MGFRKFLFFYIASVAIPTTIIFLYSMGKEFEILQEFLTFAVYFVIAFCGFTAAHILGDKVTEAAPEEIQREDDVLLQTVGFSQSTLVVLLSLMQSEDRLRLFLLSMTVIVTILFYALRAWAKIKDSPKYRYYSMIALAFLLGNTVASILKLYFNIPDDFILHMSTIVASVGIAFAKIAATVFKKRYGYESSS